MVEAAAVGRNTLELVVIRHVSFLFDQPKRSCTHHTAYKPGIPHMRRMDPLPHSRRHTDSCWVLLAPLVRPAVVVVRVVVEVVERTVHGRDPYYAGEDYGLGSGSGIDPAQA